MTPPTVNAYYDPQMNNINFPAGILQPPFFDNKADDAVNFGGIGMVIGHELTHGFDDQGRQFDAQGNLRDWWTPADAKAFEEREACIADEYASFTPVPGVHLNGKLTLGENTADNGGVRIALMALLNTIGSQNQKKIDGFTPEQRFFLSFGQIWCENQREEALRLRAQTDPHSPGKDRVNGVVQNMPEFQKAFACKAASPWWLPTPAMCGDKPLLANHVRPGPVVFRADELDQLRVRHNPLVHFDGERLGVRLRIFDRDLDFQAAVIHAPETLGQFSSVGQRAAIDIEPHVVAETGSLHHQGVAVPLADRVTIPPRLRIVAGQGPSVGENLPDASLRLVQNDDYSRSLDDFPRLRMGVKLHEAERQAVRVGIVFAVFGHALLQHLRGPRL